MSQEDPSTIVDDPFPGLNANVPYHSVDLQFSALATAVPGTITPITVIVRQQGQADITLFLNLVVPQPVTLAPNPPDKVTATAVSSSQINLSWDAAPGATGYVVDQFIGGNFKEIASVGDNITSYSVVGLSPGTEYEFRVGAFNSANPTDSSFEVGYPVAKTFPAAAPRPLATQTLIIGQQPMIKRKLNKKGKPVGKATLSGFTLDFGVALNAGAAGNAGNYQVDTITTKKIKKKTVQSLHPIKNFTVTYVAASDAVQITFGTSEKFPTGGQLTVLSGVTTASGDTLSGNAVFTIAKGGKSIVAS